ncbi:MAG: glycosyltransferase family 2 protein [Burkholderiales bacterium]
MRAYALFAVVLVAWIMSLLGGWLLDGLLAWAAGLFYVAYDTWLLAYVAWHTRKLRYTPPVSAGELDSKANDAPVTLAVLIAARNEELMLPVCLRALLAQTDMPDEILVIDDGSTDATCAVLEREFALVADANAKVPSNGAQLTCAGRIRVLHKVNAGKASALNDGLQCVRSDVVITIDADTLLEPQAIAAMRSAFAQNAALVAACGVLRPRCAPGWRGRVFEWFQTFEYLRAFLSRVAWMRIDALLLVSGAFAGYRRLPLLQVGGYRASSRVEDYELIHRMHRHSHEHALGWHIRVVSGASAETDAPASLRYFLRQRSRWFAGFLETLLANRDMVGNPRYAAVGRFMLPVKTVDTLQPVFGLTAFALLLYFLVTQQPVLQLVLLVIAVKLALDVLFHLWSVYLYHRWLGQRVAARTWWLAVAAAFAEPFSFQLLRHSGALSGWGSFLSKRTDWVPQRQNQALALSKNQTEERP